LTIRNEKKKETLNYLIKDVPKSLAANLELLRHTSIKIPTDHTKRYYGSLVLLMRLSRSERIFLDFITEEMDEKNYITNSIQIRTKFNAIFIRAGQKAFSDKTIHRCFAGLLTAELVLKSKGRGLYQVNPLFYFRGTEIERKKVMRERLEELNRVPINKYRQKIIIQKTVASSQKPITDSTA